jgi:hypothetical protein
MRWALIIAIVSGWLSLVGLLFIVYLLLAEKKAGLGKKAAPHRVVAGAGGAVNEAPALVDAEAGAWGLFVMFDNPSMGLNERLGTLLASTGAVSESRTKTFTLAGDSPRNPIHIANAYPPGTLPSFNHDNGTVPIKGISVKMIKKNRSATPNKLQLARLVTLTREITRLGGKAVDAEKHPVSEQGFQAVISGNARV